MHEKNCFKLGQMEFIGSIVNFKPVEARHGFTGSINNIKPAEAFSVHVHTSPLQVQFLHEIEFFRAN
jgi:hypothetical protein